MTRQLWVWREVVPSDQPGDAYPTMKKLTATGRAFVMKSPNADDPRGTTEVLGVFDSYDDAMKMVEIANDN